MVFYTDLLISITTFLIPSRTFDSWIILFCHTCLVQSLVWQYLRLNFTMVIILLLIFLLMSVLVTGWEDNFRLLCPHPQIPVSSWGIPRPQDPKPTVRCNLSSGSWTCPTVSIQCYVPVDTALPGANHRRYPCNLPKPPQLTEIFNLREQ